jgi:excisionase family DNA binding protein
MGGSMAEVLTIEEAAARLKLKPQTVRDWLKDGKLKGVKLGRVWRVDAEALDRLLAGDEDADDIAAAEAALADPERIPHDQVRRELGLS